MKIRQLHPGWLLLAAGIGWAGAAAGYEGTRLPSAFHVPLAATSSLYELADPAPVSSARWDPLFGSRLELSAGLLPRHEVRLAMSAWVRGSADGLDLAWPAQGYGANWMSDPLRATYRYTFLERRDWALKVGVTARLGDGDSMRVPAGGIDRTRFGSLPLVHLAGEGRLARDWLLSVDADGLMTARGRALDIGVRINYLMTRSFSLFGGYRLSDHYSEGEDATSGPSNSANVGLRYRF